MNTTFGERLEYALKRLKISQTELAKRAGVSQQAINYIVNKKLNESRFSASFAIALGINPQWLILGVGEFHTETFLKIPIINSFIELQKYLRGDPLAEGNLKIVTEADLGELPFAFQTKLSQIAVCSTENRFNAQEYLTVEEAKIEVINRPAMHTYPIYEWRKRCVEY